MSKGVLTGLKSLKRLAESSNYSSNEPRKSAFLKVEDGHSATLRFLQELDPSHKFFDEDRGLAVSCIEHSDPNNFKTRFLCTADEEGVCVGCERVAIDPKWRKRSRLYVNVYVVEDQEVKVAATGFSGKAYGTHMIEYAEDFKSICDRPYKLKRTGTSMNTQYTLFPKEPSDFDLSSVKLHDLGNWTKYRSYNECLALISGKEAELPLS